MKNKIKNKGLTLIEALIAIGISSFIGLTAIQYSLDKMNDNKSTLFSKEMNMVLSGFDQRLSIDGYDWTLWNTKSWNNSNIRDLIQKDFQATNSKCGNGEWIPSNGDSKLQLVNCDLLNQVYYDLNIDIKIEKDISGYINNSIVEYSFQNDNLFNENFKYFKKAFYYAKKDAPKTITGSIFYSYINKSTKNIISLPECMSLKSQCAFRTTLNRQGGEESLKVNGANSMIGSTINFISDKGNAPLKCVRWYKNNSNNWIKEEHSNKKDCGIGIYNKDNTIAPVSVEVISSNGTFENITLDKSCPVFEWDAGNKKVKNKIFKTMPCGIVKEGTEIIQLVDNIHSDNGYFKNLYASNLKLNTLNADTLISNNLTATQATILTTLKTNMLEVGGTTTLNGNLTGTTASFSGNISGNNISGNNISGNNGSFSGNINSNSSTNDKLYVKDIYKKDHTVSNINFKNDIYGQNIDVYDVNVRNNLTIANNLSLNTLNATTVNSENLNIEGVSTFKDHIRLSRDSYSGNYDDANCSVNGTISVNSDGHILNCIDGKYQNVNRTLSRKWVAVNRYTNTTYWNNSKNEQTLNLWGGTDPSTPNRCDISVYSNGILIGNVRNNNPDWGKTCFLTVTIPHKGSYIIQSNPYGASSPNNGRVSAALLYRWQ